MLKSLIILETVAKLVIFSVCNLGVNAMQSNVKEKKQQQQRDRNEHLIEK